MWRASDLFQLLAVAGSRGLDAVARVAHGRADCTGKEGRAANDGDADDDEDESVLGSRSARFVSDEVLDEVGHDTNTLVQAGKAPSVSQKAAGSIPPIAPVRAGIFWNRRDRFVFLTDSNASSETPVPSRNDQIIPNSVTDVNVSVTHFYFPHKSAVYIMLMCGC
ncbi:MAG: hypothetical protein R3E14_08620 [Erythrobacter sp.]